LVISRRCFAESNKEMDQDLKHTCTAIVMFVPGAVAVVVCSHFLIVISTTNMKHCYFDRRRHRRHRRRLFFVIVVIIICFGGVELFLQSW